MVATQAAGRERSSARQGENGQGGVEQGESPLRRARPQVNAVHGAEGSVREKSRVGVEQCVEPGMKSDEGRQG